MTPPPPEQPERPPGAATSPWSSWWDTLEQLGPIKAADGTPQSSCDPPATAAMTYPEQPVGSSGAFVTFPEQLVGLPGAALTLLEQPQPFEGTGGTPKTAMTPHSS